MIAQTTAPGIIIKMAKEIQALEIRMHEILHREFVGKKVRVTCPKWNGQTYGRSRKPLTGKEFVIWWANCTDAHGIYFQVYGADAVLPLDKCEVLK